MNGYKVRKTNTNLFMKGNEFMKKNIIRKMLSAVSSVIMVSAMAVSSITASAVTTPNSGSEGEDAAKVLHTVSSASDLTFTINKDIVLFNEEALNIFEPNITYTYTVAPASVDAGTTITGLTADDEDGDATVTVAVRAGVAGGVTIKGATDAAAGGTANLVFGNDTGHAKETNAEATSIDVDVAKTTDRALTVTINQAAFNAAGLDPKPTAGVYRYTITDTTPAAELTGAGIVRDADYNPVRYLDVYTKYNNSGALEVYGYVLLKANGSIEYSTETGVTEVTKVTGFDIESETDNTGVFDDGNTISDQYHTYNVDIKKEVEGDLGDKNHAFPFQIELTNATNTKAAEFYFQHSTAASPTDGVFTYTEGSGSSWTYGTLANTSTLKLKDGETFTINGLPKDTMIKVTELNDTADTYTVTATGNSASLGLTKSNPANGETAAMSTAFDIDNSNTKDTITFTNTLKDISVTGVIFIIAPFAAIVLAGMIFFVMFMKNKKKNNGESNSVI